MRAAVISSPGIVEIQDLPMPTPGAGEVRLRVENCGVCASNLAVWAGKPWFTYPLPAGEPGHEATGWIDAIGAGVNGWKVGARVAALTSRSYAEFDLAKQESLVALPPELDDHSVPGEPLGCAMNIFARAGVMRGSTVAIIGIGFLGAVLIQLAAGAGANVIALGRRPFALELARNLGAAEVISLSDPQVALDRVRELTAAKWCSVTIEAAGAQSTLDFAAEITAVRGRLVIAGYHQDGPRQINLQLWNWRGLDVINAHERDSHIYVEGIRSAAAALQSGRINLQSLCTHFLPLEELGQALDLTRDRPDGFMKAMIRL